MNILHETFQTIPGPRPAVKQNPTRDGLVDAMVIRPRSPDMEAIPGCRQDLLSAASGLGHIQQPNRPLPKRPHFATEVAISGLTETVIESPGFKTLMATCRVGSVV
jgi:hypothetical protein